MIDLIYENYLLQTLSGRIAKDNWVDQGTVLINCDPAWSSRLTHFLSHTLLPSQEPLQVINLELPQENMSQVWDESHKEYVLFDRYLKRWVSHNILPPNKYLFVNLLYTTAKNENKIRYAVRSMVDYKFATLLLQDTSSAPDYYATIFRENQRPSFFWENNKKQ